MFLGIDIAKSSFDAAYLDAEGKSRQKCFENNPKGFASLIALVSISIADVGLFGAISTGASKGRSATGARDFIMPSKGIAAVAAETAVPTGFLFMFSREYVLG